MMKQLFFVLFLATVVFMVSAEPLPEVDGEETKALGAEAEAEEHGENGSSMTTMATASLIGLAFNVLMNVWQ